MKLNETAAIVIDSAMNFFKKPRFPKEQQKRFKLMIIDVIDDEITYTNKGKSVYQCVMKAYNELIFKKNTIN